MSKKDKENKKVFKKGNCNFEFTIPEKFQKLAEKTLRTFFTENIGLALKTGNIQAEDIDIFLE